MSKLKWGKRVCGIFLLWAGAAVALPAQTFNTIYNFCSQGGSACTDGTDPAAGLVQGSDGNFYGTTAGYSGISGTVFKITPKGTLTTLHIFDGTDGIEPSPVIQAADENLYGTTFLGGANDAGTVFKITPSGTLTTLYNFCSQGGSACTDGSNAFAGVTQGTDGNFYGTTELGGGASGLGTVFKISPSGKLKTLHSFDGTDGQYPVAALVQGTDGNFYGTTANGGSAGCINGCGTVFKMTPSGTLTTLRTFDLTDGASPYARLIQGTDGTFYGTTHGGGAMGDGTVFNITPSGTLTMLYSFCAQGGNCTDGSFPGAGLLQASDGNFYGTTVADSNGKSCPPNCGTIFKITPSGTLTTLYAFCTHRSNHICQDGADAFGMLAENTNGKIYGTTAIGGREIACGSPGCGTVFTFSTGLSPIAETFPVFGPAGAHVKILGTNLAGATSVTFNGTAATFTALSESLIATTVPAGATTGTVQVVTPGGTLSSNVPFTVK